MHIHKLLSLLLAAALLLSLAGCVPHLPDPSDSTPSTNIDTTHPPLTPEIGSYWADYAGSRVIAGEWATALRPAGSSGTVTYNDTYQGGNGRDYSDSGHYTYREYISSTGGLKWAPHTWETASDSYILDYTSTGFYRFTLNSDLSGWTIVDEMAMGAPEDVTAQYAGQFGITEGETARAFRINLNPNACWADGTPIIADTYIYSYKELLHPKMMNRRADSLYASDFAIVGAKDYLYGKVGWENVGVLKVGDYALVLITTTAVADPEFYVPYNLTSTYLVYEPLWEACKTGFDKDGNPVAANSDQALSITTNYSTSLETSMSYGPYKLTEFEPDKQITLLRNPLWHGYSDGKHLGQYQADTISCQVLSNQSTALLSFLGGDLDSISLSSADMEKYAASDYIRYIPETYTTKLTFNTDPDALSKRGSQVLSNVYFRKAFSLAIDRTRFAAAYTSAGAPGYGILNSMYIYDPYTGSSYRDSESAKNALVRLNGLTFGPEGDYPTLDDAYRAITGYDPTLARQYMQQAYEEVTDAGLYDGHSPVTLQLSVYQNEDIYVQMYHFLRDALTDACKGTDFEGLVDLEMVVDEDYYATMESGLTDIIFSTWGGSAYDPYGLLFNCYCDGGVAEYPNQMEYGFDAAAVSVTIRLDGTDYTATLQDWARWCAGDPEVTISDAEKEATLPSFRDYDAYTRCAIYADLEFAYLSQLATTPLYYRNSATLQSQKGHYPTDRYDPLVEFGGIAFYTFDYTDEAWEQIKGELKY